MALNEVDGNADCQAGAGQDAAFLFVTYTLFTDCITHNTIDKLIMAKILILQCQCLIY